METHVVATSCYSLRQITSGGFSWKVGNGTFFDEVMLSAVRNESRINFNIISDSFNTFEHLYSTAKFRETVFYIVIVEPTGNKGLAGAVEIIFKGRREPLREKL